MKIEHLDSGGHHNLVPGYDGQRLLGKLAAGTDSRGATKDYAGFMPDGKGGVYYVDTSKHPAGSQSEIDQETTIGSITDEHGKVFFVSETEINDYLASDLLSVVPQNSSERVIISWPVRYGNGDSEFSSYTLIVPNQEFSSIDEFRNVSHAGRLPFDWLAIIPPDNEHIDYGCYKIKATRAICDNPAKDGEFFASQKMIDLREGSVVTRVRPAEYLDESWYEEMRSDMMDIGQIIPSRRKLITKVIGLADNQTSR